MREVKPLDFRSSALPGAKYAAARGRRKFTAEEQEAPSHQMAFLDEPTLEISHALEKNDILRLHK